MAESTNVKVKRDGSLVVNGAGGGETYTVDYTDGDVKFTNAKNARVVIRSRNTIRGVRAGEQPVLQITFSVHFRQFTDGGDLNLLDIIDRRGAAAAWTRVGGANFIDFPTWNYVFSVEGSTSDGADSVATFATCEGDWALSEGDPDKVDITLSCYGGITFTGPA